MDLPEPLRKTERAQQFKVGIIHWSSKPVCFVLLQSFTALVVANAFLNQLMYAYGASAFGLTDNEKLSALKFFGDDCAMLGREHYLTAAYHPQKKTQTQQFSEIVVQRLPRYVEEHWKDWYIYLQPLTYAFIFQDQP